MKTSLIVLICFMMNACATDTKSRLLTTAVATAVGAAIGYTTAPSDERPELHALYWAGLTGVAASVAANFYFNDERDHEVLTAENEKLKAQMDVIQNGSSILLKDTTGPADKKYFSSGKARLRLYKVDQWVDDGPNKKVHQDQIIEVSPIEKGQR